MSDVAMVAVKVELEMKLVISAEPLKLTTDPETKFVPFTVRVKLGPPASVEVGEMLVVVGTGLFIVSVCVFDVPPPGAAFTTVIEAVPAVAISEARIVVVSVVLETKAVTRDEPLKSAVEDALKFVPLMVSVNCAPPAVVEVGEMLLVVGAGLLIVSVCEFDVPPPGAEFTTVIEAVPAVAISEARIVAVSVVLEMNVVARPEPLKSTVDEATKFVPFTVRVKSEPPASVEVGEMLVVVGTGFRIVNVCAARSSTSRSRSHHGD